MRGSDGVHARVFARARARARDRVFVQVLVGVFGMERVGGAGIGCALGAGMFAFERLDAYQVAVELRKLVIKKLVVDCRGDLRDQIDRATASVILNIAEGAGRMGAKEKRRFYKYALGSVSETAAILAVIRVDAPTPTDDHINASTLADRIGKMLYRLIEKT